MADGKSSVESRSGCQKAARKLLGTRGQGTWALPHQGWLDSGHRILRGHETSGASQKPCVRRTHMSIWPQPSCTALRVFSLQPWLPDKQLPPQDESFSQ